MILQAIAVALKMSIYIYQVNSGHLQILKHHSGQECLCDVHVKLTHQPWCEIFNHYEPNVTSCRQECSCYFISNEHQPSTSAEAKLSQVLIPSDDSIQLTSPERLSAAHKNTTDSTSP